MREIRTARNDHRSVAVVGPCSISDGEIERLAADGVPGDVVWRWAGSYAVVEVVSEETALWTDIGGAWPIYTLETDEGTYWSSSSRALAALTGHRLNRVRLAASLMAPTAPILHEGQSAFDDVSLIPAGSRLSLPIYGQSVLERVWYPKSVHGDPAPRLRTELDAAVSVRVDHAAAPTCDLSGGYDSTALALVAAARLRSDTPIVGVTVHPAGVTSVGDLAYAQEAALHPGIAHHLMPLQPNVVPYNGLGSLPATDEPAPSTIAYARFSAQLRWMRDQFGSDCHMTGDGGDSLLLTHPTMLIDLLARRQLRRSLSEAIALARLRRVSVWPLLASAIRTARRGRRAALRTLAHSLRVGTSSADRKSVVDEVGWLPHVSIPSWSTVDTRELAATAATNAADRLDEIKPGDCATRLTAELMADVGRSARADIQLAEHHGVALHNPFVDSRIMDTVLSVPVDMQPGPAEYKPLLRRAMSDLFPLSLAQRSTKGSFTSDYYGGMRSNMQALHEMAEGLLAEIGLVDPHRLRQTITLAAAGVPAAFATVEPVIATEAWLRAIHSASAVRWRSVEDAQVAP